MKKIFRIALIIVLILVAGFLIWAETPAQADSEAIQALNSDSVVTITQHNGWYIFSPTDQNPQTGLIFYPGGRVDEKAYSLVLREIAAQGYWVVLVPMPLNLAVFNSDAAGEIQATFPEIQSWAVGGHSLGGAIAANFAAANPGMLDGLVLWASYPTGSDNLTQSGLKVVSIFASLDGLTTEEKIDASRVLLPAETLWVEIQGGNHAQFGNYGVQAGDNPATITREEQRQKVVDATVKMLEMLQ